MNESEILRDIRKRHATLHVVDKACAASLTALIPAISAAVDHGLLAEMDAVRDALSALHAAAKRKFDAL